ncbi:Pyridine nucleotide-disulfide oxidoreductase [Pseudomonas sp. GM50]|nr:Pyridine nucleotide-disulfide oxidoreductase [Pseudomonas sp. GM50]
MKHKIVIVGGGAGGLELATKLGKRFGKSDKASITLVDASLTHIWKPLLHEVAADALSSATEELNYHAQAKWNHFSFELGTMEGLDRNTQTLRLVAVIDENDQQLIPARMLSYDTLVMAVGSTSNDFGIAGAKEHTVFLDTRKQADLLHRKLLNAYLASAGNPDIIGSVSIAIVGAGATGVELAAELRHAAEELSSYGLGQISPENLKITLIEAGPRILLALPERIGNALLKTLERLGVNDMVNAGVSSIDPTGQTTHEGQRIESTLKVWERPSSSRIWMASKPITSINWWWALRCRPLAMIRSSPLAIVRLVSIRIRLETCHLAPRRPTNKPRHWSSRSKRESRIDPCRRSNTRITVGWYLCRDFRQLAT